MKDRVIDYLIRKNGRADWSDFRRFCIAHGWRLKDVMERTKNAVECDQVEVRLR